MPKIMQNLIEQYVEAVKKIYAKSKKDCRGSIYDKNWQTAGPQQYLERHEEIMCQCKCLRKESVPTQSAASVCRNLLCDRKRPFQADGYPWTHKSDHHKNLYSRKWKCTRKTDGKAETYHNIIFVLL